jgi:hypothetical protein
VSFEVSERRVGGQRRAVGADRLLVVVRQVVAAAEQVGVVGVLRDALPRQREAVGQVGAGEEHRARAQDGQVFEHDGGAHGGLL